MTDDDGWNPPITEAEVDLALRAILTATTRARALCATYAEQVTGWAPGTRITNSHGYRAEVVGFSGTHPNWSVRPVVHAKLVLKSGATGVRNEIIVIDTEGRWRQRWQLETAIQAKHDEGAP